MGDGNGEHVKVVFDIDVHHVHEWERLHGLGMPTSSKTDEFSEKFQGGGGHFQSKNLCCKIWTFKQGYLTMKLIQRGLFRLCFFNNCIDKNQNKTHFEEDTSESSPPLELFRKFIRIGVAPSLTKPFGSD